MAIPTPEEKLKIIIVGAGICGLACGAALREHADVTVRPSPFPFDDTTDT